MKKVIILDDVIGNVLELIKAQHTGERNAITSKVIEEKFGVSGERLRDIIHSLRMLGFPICSSRKGYFYAESEDEINLTIANLSSRVKSMRFAINGLKSSKKAV